LLLVESITKSRPVFNLDFRRALCNDKSAPTIPLERIDVHDIREYNSHHIDRRNALKLIAGAGLGTAAIGYGNTISAEETDNAAVTFGFSLYGMKDVAPADAFKILRRIGYDATELVCMPDWSTAPEKLSKSDRESLREHLNEVRLQLPALMENLPLLVSAEQRKTHLDRIKAAGELGHDLSPDEPPVIETIMGGKPADWPKVRNEMVDELGNWAKAAEECKTVVAVKPHVSGAVHAPEAADWLIRQVNSPWIRLAYDYSHYHVRQFDFQKSLDLLLPHTAFIHVKDNIGEDGKVQFALPGTGGIDYQTYFEAVKKSKYHGTVMVEVSSQLWRKPDYDPVKAAQTSFTNLQPVFQETGLWNG
jgi:sugar phosphate isomerase/epimerase